MSGLTAAQWRERQQKAKEGTRHLQLLSLLQKQHQEAMAQQHQGQMLADVVVRHTLAAAAEAQRAAQAALGAAGARPAMSSPNVPSPTSSSSSDSEEETAAPQDTVGPDATDDRALRLRG